MKYLNFFYHDLFQEDFIDSSSETSEEEEIDPEGEESLAYVFI